MKDPVGRWWRNKNQDSIISHKAHELSFVGRTLIMHYGFIKKNSSSNGYPFQVLARMRTLSMSLSFWLNFLYRLDKRYFPWKVVTGFHLWFPWFMSNKDLKTKQINNSTFSNYSHLTFKNYRKHKSGVAVMLSFYLPRFPPPFKRKKKLTN